jgi:hypothetical protein
MGRTLEGLGEPHAMNTWQKRLHALETRQPPADDPRFDFLNPADRPAWRSVTEATKRRLWQQHERMGGTGITLCLVAGHEADEWRVCAFNLPYGRCQYCITASWRDVGDDRFLAWTAELAPDALDALARAILGHWDPDTLQPGDLDRLTAMIDKLPR